jgi:hypothetical protein
VIGVSARCRHVGFAAVAATVALSGCASAARVTGSTMMGGSSYHYSALTCSAPKSLPGAVITVTLADMGMTQTMAGIAPRGVLMLLRATPRSVTAGQISIVAANRGWRSHELVVLPLPTGASPGQRVTGTDGRVDETGSLGEASASCADGAGDGLAARTVGWTTITLAPGRYELLCNLPNHYADGMWQELDVT